MFVPLYVLGSIVVPNLQPLQNAAIHRVTRKMVASVANTTWEKQAINKVVRVVRSNSKTVRSVCEKAARQFDSLSSRPPCLCHLMHDVPGHKIEIEGHLAFVPIHITYPNGTTARPNEPLPHPGNSVRKCLMRDLQAMGERIGATVPHLTRYLPRDLWPETGSTPKYIEQFVRRVSPAMYIRCVYKGTRVMWAFFRHWVWEY